MASICRYPSTTDHSFYNFANIDGQVYERVTLSSLKDDMTRKGPFAAQKLVFENSNQMMHMCYINTMQDVDEAALEETFARMLITIESMRAPDSSDYIL